MNVPTSTRTIRHLLASIGTLAVALILPPSTAACGGDSQPSQDNISEFGAVSTHEVETSEESPANDVGKAIVGGVLGAIWLVVCIFLGSWWSLLVVPFGTFCWVLEKKSKYYGFRYAASDGLIWSLLAAAATLMVVLLCWIF